jgi:hypothetical protein
MADISVLSRLINGIQRNVDLSANTLVLSSLKLGTSELTKAKLDLLALTTDSPSAVDASAQHHHDGRYYTESELAAQTDGASGASLIGIDVTPAFSNFTSGNNVQSALEGIDTALASAGGSSFSDADFEIYQDGDTSAKSVWDLSAVSTATTRTITMPNANVDLGEIATNTTHSSGDGSDHQDVADLATLSGVAANSTDLGTFTGTTIPDTQTIKQALQALETKAEANTALVNGLEWQDSALDYVVDNTAVPATEVTGDRYILSHDGGAPNAAWDGASAGDIVEFNGSTWDATTPTVGMFISADDESTLLYYWGGAAWTTKAFESTTASTGLTKVGFDIRLADAAASNGIAVSSGAISVQLSATPGLEFSSNLLQVKVDATGGANLASVVDRNSNGVAIRVDDSSIEDDGNGGTAQLRVKAGGVTNTMLAGSIDDSKLNQITTADKVAGSAVQVNSNGSISDSTGLLANHAPKLEEQMTAGESFTANTSFLVRMALNGETAGRVYKADKAAGAAGAETNTIYVVGLAQNRTGSAITAGNPIPVVKWGNAELQSSDSDFTATQDEGLPVYLGDAGAFSLAVSSTTDDAIVKVGVVRNVGVSSAIEMSAPQIMGIA